MPSRSTSTASPRSPADSLLAGARPARRLWYLLTFLALAGLAAWTWTRSPADALVVYCAHDWLYAEPVLRDFERETGIRVEARFDTEATKSLGLVELIAREKQRPRCDVFWNNEPLGVMRLKAEGLLLPYRGPGFERIPRAYKDEDGFWTGFAARLRVWIVNTERMPATEPAIERALDGDLTRMAVAKPLFGTTRAHTTVLWDLWGEERLRDWHASLRARGVREVSGNATVKNLVAAGTCDFGLTDTDDFFLARDEGRPVAMVPVRVGGGRTVCIPNTVAIVRGTRHPQAARKLVDHLLSERTELALARSASRQIPLGPTDPRDVPDEVRQLVDWAASAYPFARIDASRRSCLAWLRSESSR